MSQLSDEEEAAFQVPGRRPSVKVKQDHHANYEAVKKLKQEQTAEQNRESNLIAHNLVTAARDIRQAAIERKSYDGDEEGEKNWSRKGVPDRAVFERLLTVMLDPQAQGKPATWLAEKANLPITTVRWIVSLPEWQSFGMRLTRSILLPHFLEVVDAMVANAKNPTKDGVQDRKLFLDLLGWSPEGEGGQAPFEIKVVHVDNWNAPPPLTIAGGVIPLERPEVPCLIIDVESSPTEP